MSAFTECCKEAGRRARKRPRQPVPHARTPHGTTCMHSNAREGRLPVQLASSSVPHALFRTPPRGTECQSPVTLAATCPLRHDHPGSRPAGARSAGRPWWPRVRPLLDRYSTVTRPLRPLYDRWSPVEREYAIYVFMCLGLGAFLPSLHAPGVVPRRNADPGIKTPPEHCYALGKPLCFAGRNPCARVTVHAEDYLLIGVPRVFGAQTPRTRPLYVP